jgi:predicted transcriptional regulator
MERGRAKAHRPLSQEVRTAAVERGLAAYGRGAWYLAHEELEPAWMGTDDPAERPS